MRFLPGFHIRLFRSRAFSPVSDLLPRNVSISNLMKFNPSAAGAMPAVSPKQPKTKPDREFPIRPIADARCAWKRCTDSSRHKPPCGNSRATHTCGRINTGRLGCCTVLYRVCVSSINQILPTILSEIKKHMKLAKLQHEAFAQFFENPTREKLRDLLKIMLAKPTI